MKYQNQIKEIEKELFDAIKRSVKGKGVLLTGRPLVWEKESVHFKELSEPFNGFNIVNGPMLGAPSVFRFDDGNNLMSKLVVRGVRVVEGGAGEEDVQFLLLDEERSEHGWYVYDSADKEGYSDMDLSQLAYIADFVTETPLVFQGDV